MKDRILVHEQPNMKEAGLEINENRRMRHDEDGLGQRYAVLWWAIIQVSQL